VTHTLLSTPAPHTGRHAMSIKVLAYEDFQWFISVMWKMVLLNL
jgi:hypothetical protein